MASSSGAQIASERAPAISMRRRRGARSSRGAASHVCTPTTATPSGGEDELVAVLEQGAEQRHAGRRQPSVRAPGIEGAQPGQQRQRQHADEQLLEVAGERDQMDRPEQEQRPGDEGRAARQADAAGQRVEAPARERDAEEGGAVEGRGCAPRPERQRQDAVQRPDAIDEHRDPVREEQLRGIGPADPRRQCLRRVPQHPDGVALVVMDVADRVGGEVAGERPARRDRQREIAERHGEGGPCPPPRGRCRLHRAHTVTRSSTCTGASPPNASLISRSSLAAAVGALHAAPGRPSATEPSRKID